MYDQQTIPTLLSRLRTADAFLRVILSTTPEALLTGQETEDFEVAANILKASSVTKRLVENLLTATVRTAEELELYQLEKQAENFIIALRFGVRSKLIFSEDIIEEMILTKKLASEALERVMEVKNCLIMYLELPEETVTGLGGTREYIQTNDSYSSYTTSGNYETTLQNVTGQDFLTRGYDIHPEYTTAQYLNTTLKKISETTTTNRITTDSPDATSTSPPSLKPRIGTHETTPFPVHRPTSPYGSWVVGLVSGYRLEMLTSLISPQLPPSHQTHSFIMTHMARVRHLEFRAGVFVDGVGGVDVGRLVRHGILLSSPTLTNILTFTSTVGVDGEMRTMTINGVTAGSYITLSGRHGFPRSTTTFSSVVSRGQMIIRSTINRHDLTAFISSVVLTSASSVQVLQAPVTFLNLAAPRVDSSSGRVVGLDLEDLVLRGSNVVITGRKRFGSVMVREGVVGVDSLSLHLINYINITQLFHHSLKRTSGEVQVLSQVQQLSSLAVLGDLTTTQGITLPSPPPTGSHTLFVHRLAERVVWRDRGSIITGGLVLSGTVAVKSLTFKDKFDSVSGVTYNRAWLLRTSSQTVSHTVTVSRVSSPHVTLAAGVRLQGVDLALLLQSSVLTSSSAPLPLSLRFTGRVWAARVEVQGRVQGWKLSRQAILRSSTNVIFTAAKTFMSSIHVTGILRPSLIDMTAVCENVDASKLTIVGSVRFLGRVQADMIHIGRHAVKGDKAGDYWFVDRDFVLPNTLFFSNLEASRVVTQAVNGIDLSKKWAGCLKTVCGGVSGQVVTASYTFSALLTTSLVTPTIMAVTLNGRSTSDLNHLFMMGGSQMVRGRWSVARGRVRGSVMVGSGMVGGAKVAEWCVSDLPCKVTATKTFSQDLTILGDLDVKPGRLVQGVDVSEALRQMGTIASLTTATCGTIPGIMTFTSLLAFSKLRVKGVIDGVNLTSTQVLTRSGIQIMKGPVVITNTRGPAVTTPRVTSVDDLFNDFNLTKLLTDMFRLDEGAVTVRGAVTLTGRVLFTDALYGAPPTDILSSLGDSGVRALASLPSLARSQPHFLTLHTHALSSHHALLDSAREAWGWRRVQELTPPTLRVVPLSEREGGLGSGASCLPRLALLPRTGHARILTYSATQRRYIDLGVVVGGRCVRAVVGWAAEGEDYLATAHTCSAPSPSHNTSIPTQYSHGQDVEEEVVQVWMVTTSPPRLLQKMLMPRVIDLQVVVVRARRCLVVIAAGAPHTQVLCQPPRRNTFTHHQNLTTGPPVKVSVGQHKDPGGRMVTVMAVVGTKVLTAWMFDTEQDRFELLQREAVKEAVWVDLVSHGSDLLLAVVSKAFRGKLEAHVTIYRLTWDNGDWVESPLGHCGPPWNTTFHPALPTPDARLVLPQTLPQLVEVQVLVVKEAGEAHFSAPPIPVRTPASSSSPVPISAQSLLVGQLYLFVNTYHGDLIWYTQHGIHRFQHEGGLHTPGQQAVAVWRGCDGGLWVAVTAGGLCSDHPIPATEPDVILEAKYRPPRPSN